MNELNNTLELQKKKIRKITNLTTYLVDLKNMADSEFLSDDVKDQFKPIIKSVMEKLNEVSKQ